jgi:hypothetical protein
MFKLTFFAEAIRRTAEFYMHDLVRVIFTRLETIDPATDEDGASGDDERNELRMTVSPVREKPTESIEDALETAVPEKEKEVTPTEAPPGLCLPLSSPQHPDPCYSATIWPSIRRGAVESSLSTFRSQLTSTAIPFTYG